LELEISADAPTIHLDYCSLRRLSADKDRPWAEQARQVKRRMPDGYAARVFKVAQLDAFLDALSEFPETR